MKRVNWGSIGMSYLPDPGEFHRVKTLWTISLTNKFPMNSDSKLTRLQAEKRGREAKIWYVFVFKHISSHKALSKIMALIYYNNNFLFTKLMYTHVFCC